MTRRQTLLALVGAMVLAAPAAAADDPAAPIRSVIQSQLDAFQADDAAGAYAFAAPSIQRMFPTPEIFMTMVQRGYPEVYRPGSVEFGELAPVDGRLLQKVWITGQSGARVLALYTMVRLQGGEWRIAGCVLLRPQEQSA